MAEQNVASDVITVWSDISCPWATLALHTLRSRAAALGVTVGLDHRVFPLELINAEPAPQPAHDAEVSQIMAVRAELGWAAWSGPDWAYPVTTLPALQAVQAAKIQGLQAADALDAALRSAFYVEGRSISLVPVIEEVARQCPAVDAERLADTLRAGAGQVAVNTDFQVAAGGTIQGSPHFWTAAGPYAANPGVDDVANFQHYDASWADDLIARVRGQQGSHGAGG